MDTPVLTPLPLPARPAPEPRWRALTNLPLANGAIIIRSAAAGDFIGWATGVFGHTVEPSRHDGLRDPAEIRRNAAKMALAPVMLDVCRLLVHGSQQRGAEALPATVEAAELAATVLAELGLLS